MAARRTTWLAVAAAVLGALLAICWRSCGAGPTAAEPIVAGEDGRAPAAVEPLAARAGEEPSRRHLTAPGGEAEVTAGPGGPGPLGIFGRLLHRDGRPAARAPFRWAPDAELRALGVHRRGPAAGHDQHTDEHGRFDVGEVDPAARGVVAFDVADGVVLEVALRARGDEQVVRVPTLFDVSGVCHGLRADDRWWLALTPVAGGEPITPGEELVVDGGPDARLALAAAAAAAAGDEPIRLPVPGRLDVDVHASAHGAVVEPASRRVLPPISLQFQASGPLPPVVVEIYEAANGELTAMRATATLRGRGVQAPPLDVYAGRAELHWREVPGDRSHRLRVVMEDDEAFESTVFLTRNRPPPVQRFVRGRGRRPLRMHSPRPIAADARVVVITSDRRWLGTDPTPPAGLEYGGFVAAVRGDELVVHDLPERSREVLVVDRGGRVLRSDDGRWLAELEPEELPPRRLADLVVPGAETSVAVFELELRSARGDRLWLAADRASIDPRQHAPPVWAKSAPVGWRHRLRHFVPGRAATTF